ncbi:MAG: hypothetical protein A2X12_06015 [Bacteroidetes bacterium GWE2_29_8]|nr:MAG: hypothetical protein A2X12_06015 [Bacteroidetes bacterium GWE2_29_8]OFY20052.1 MAG: hypothetical protein A2X02_06715 [Bacteroidetes bacterium GWF2_29_10]
MNYKQLNEYTLKLRKENIIFKSGILFSLLLIVLKYLIILIRPFLNKVNQENIDVLVIGTCKKDVEQTANIWESISAKYSLSRVILNKKKLLFSAFQNHNSIPKQTPYNIFLFSVFAQQLIEKYKPKIICLYTSNGPFPSIIRYYSNFYGGKTIYMPHCVIPIELYYSSLDYDYYFVFGKSSLKNLKMNDYLYCSLNTKVVLTGSPMIKTDFILQPNYLKKKILYLSNWLIGIDNEMTENFKNIILWAKTNSKYELLIKLHPIEDKNYIIKAVGQYSNIKILPINITIKEALELVSLTIITAGSSSGIEAALMNRPSVLMNVRKKNDSSIDYRDSDKQYMTEHFFVERACNFNDLEDRIETIFKNFDFYINRCKEYVDYHLENSHNSQDFIIDTIAQIINSKENFKYELIYGKGF